MSIKRRVADTPPTTDWEPLQMLIDEKKTASLLGVSLSYLHQRFLQHSASPKTPGLS
jgi:uncharacterized protein (DUF2062 family)